MTRTYPLYHEAGLVTSKHWKRSDDPEARWREVVFLPRYSFSGDQQKKIRERLAAFDIIGCKITSVDEEKKEAGTRRQRHGLDAKRGGRRKGEKESE